MGKTATYVLLGFSFVVYIIIGITPRHDFLLLLSYFTLLFTIYFLYIKRTDFEEHDVKEGIKLGLLFRLAFLFFPPLLSDDYHRFIWDGVIAQHGLNPFEYLPSEIKVEYFIKDWGLEDTYHQLNSQEYFSVYPPLNQFIFYIATFLPPMGAIILMKAIIIAAEYGTVKLLIALLKKWNMNPMKAMFYFLNPLVIVELTGNLHFEAVMIFFIVLSIYLLVKNKTYLAGIAYGLAVLTKVIPLLFLPFFIKRLGWRNSLKFFGAIGVVVVGISAFYFDLNGLQHFLESIQLYFGSFQFNASIYQWLRSFGQLFLPDSIMSKLSSLLSLIVLITITIWAFKEKARDLKSLFPILLLALTLHLALATTVHPWYITTGVALAVFTNYRYILVWSALAVLSYVTYINEPVYQELFWVNAIEYIIVFSLFILEYRKNRLQQVVYKSHQPVG